MKTNRVICGDCIETMQKFPDNSFDGVVTDPPYGLGFMGKEWDTFNRDHLNQKRTADKKRKPRTDGRTVAAWGNGADAGAYDHSRNAEFQQWFTVWAKEALRIVKPGAIMLIFGGTRTYHRLTCAIEDAGWQIRDCMMWLYGSGFPKSSGISQQFDKRACLELGIKQLGRKPTKEEFKKAWETFREFQLSPNSRSSGASPSGCYGEGVQTKTISTPVTPLAKLWDGYSTALKPAWEPIVVAMKPLDGTFAQNAEKWGVAGLNIDGGRIGTEQITAHGGGKQGNRIYGMGNGMPAIEAGSNPHQGRWPANLILDEEAAAMLDEQSGVSKSGVAINRNRGKRKPSTVNYANHDGVDVGFADSGGASRFFKTLEPEPCFLCNHTEEHGNYQVGLGVFLCDECLLEGETLDLPKRFLYCAKASRSERNAGLEGPCANNHPTVKPLKLMEYLCKLLKPPVPNPVCIAHGIKPRPTPILLDPFTGSGTTLIAAVNTGWHFIGIEKESEYCKIAEARIKTPLIRRKIRATKARRKAKR